MAEQGLASLFDYRQLAVMGLTEVLPKLPKLLRRVRDVARAIEAQRPDAVVSIDAPSFAFAVYRRLRSHRQPRIHYVAPQVWAWRPGRIRKIKKYVDHILALFPFEPAYFKGAGVDCSFVSHPVIETAATAEEGNRFRQRHGIAADALVLCALPGSRRAEVQRLSPIIVETITRLSARHPGLHVVVPTVSTVADDVRAIAATGVATTIVAEPSDKAAALAASDLAVAASGTVTLELACANVPAVVVYKVARLTGWLAKWLLNVEYVSIVNILAGREVFPEFLQWNCTPDKIVAALDRLIEDPSLRRSVIDAERDVVRQLTLDGQSPAGKAAREILRVTGEFDGHGARADELR